MLVERCSHGREQRPHVATPHDGASADCYRAVIKTSGSAYSHRLAGFDSRDLKKMKNKTESEFSLFVSVAVTNPIQVYLDCATDKTNQYYFS